METSQLKCCTKCRAEQPLSAFYRDKNKKDGFEPNCKTCRRVKDKLYSDRNKSYRRERQRQSRLSWTKEQREQYNEKRREYYSKREIRIAESKQCNMCSEIKSSDCFHKSTRHGGGLRSSCKKCLNEKKRAYYDSPEIKARRVLYYQSNKDLILQRTRLERKLNRPRENARLAKRRAQKLKATPSWLTSEHLEQIALFYTASRDQLKFGIKCHVDHIVPLQNKDVCGLHVPWNLQVLTAEENMKKNNKLAS